MKDLANETRGAQLDDRDTFLGIGQKRWKSSALSGLMYFAFPAKKAGTSGHQLPLHVVHANHLVM